MQYERHFFPLISTVCQQFSGKIQYIAHRPIKLANDC